MEVIRRIVLVIRAIDMRAVVMLAAGAVFTAAFGLLSLAGRSRPAARRLGEGEKHQGGYRGNDRARRIPVKRARAAVR